MTPTMIKRISVIVLTGMLVSSVSGSPQRTPPSQPNNFPLNLWSGHKKVTQIPWKFFTDATRLRPDFRQELPVRVEVWQSDLDKIVDSRNLMMYMRVLQGSTEITRISGVMVPLVTPIHRSTEFEPGEVEAEMKTVGRAWTQLAIARPGKYTLELAVRDRTSGRYSTRYEDIAIPGNEGDPLEKALRGLPRFEFGEKAPPPQISKPIKRSSTSDRLQSIPVDRSGSLHLSILTILSPPDAALGNEAYLASFRGNLTGFLSIFLRLDVPHGTAKLTAVDLMNRRFVVDRQNLKELPLEKIEAEIKKDTKTVSFDALAGARENGRFLRDAIRAQLEAGENDAEGAQHVIVIVAARTEIPGVSTLEPLAPARDCHCRVIYLRVAAKSGGDDIDDLLNAYKPQVFSPRDWREFRKDFGTIYQQLIR